MREERFAKNEQGEWVIVEVIEHTPETNDDMPEGREAEVIADKEAQILAMYQELEALKAAQNA